MDIREESMRMQKLIQNMTIDEFEQMLERNGIDTILPSYESACVRCMKKKFGEYGWNYNLKSDILMKQEKYLNYSLSDQGVA